MLNRIINILWARQHQGDVNHITGDVHYLALALDPKRTILTIADCVALHYSKGIRHWLLWLFWYWLPVKLSARITVISQFTKEELLRRLEIDSGRIHVIHCPAPPAYKPAGRSRQDGPPVILQVGTNRNKNLERVAGALQDIPCILNIVGPLTIAQRRVLESNRINYRSHVAVTDEELRELYTTSDLVLFVSLYEGFGLPVIEAQAAGKPVVTSNTCSMPEVAGEGGELVDPDDVQGIRKAVARILNDGQLRRGLIEKGLINVRRFDAGSIAHQYAGVYLKVGASAGPRENP